jgi:hypothetical protein
MTAVIIALSLSTIHLALNPAVNTQTSSKQAAVNTPAPSRQASSSEGGQEEAIKVHGHWTIDVLNPDGNMVTHREFQNSLQPQGATSLAGLLSRNATTGLWSVVVGGNPSPCRIGGNVPTECMISEPTDPNGFSRSKNLTIGYSASTVTLSGTATAPSDGGGTVGAVQTFLGRCSNSVAPGSLDSACLATGKVEFSSTDLVAPVNVAAGQIIQVSVVFSFS